MDFAVSQHDYTERNQKQIRNFQRYYPYQFVQTDHIRNNRRLKHALYNAEAELCT